MVICLERGANLHMSQLMLLPLTVSCFSKIQFGFTFLVLAHPGSPGKGPIIGVCVCVCVCNMCMMCLKCGVVFHHDYSEFCAMSGNEKNSVN